MKTKKAAVGRRSRTVESSNSTVGRGPTTRTRRNPRNPTPRKVKVPVGRWKPRVKLTSKGPNRADMQRKVENTEIVRVPLDGVIADLIERLRSGEDVFLDDVTTGELSGDLGVPVTPVDNDGAALLDAILGES